MQQFKVKQTSIIAPQTLMLTLQPKGKRDKLRFYPGQYAAIGYKNYGRPSLMRCFSMVSSPNRPDELQFAMRVDGNFTSSLAQLTAGDTVFLRGPFGEYCIDLRHDNNIIMLAAGIGVTPFVSMLRYAAEAHSSMPITLLYSCRSQDNIPFYEELLELEKQNPRFKVYYFVTQGGTDKLKASNVVKGRVDEPRLQKLTGGEFNKFTYFICGPKSFNNSLETMLLARQTAAERIILEEFTTGSQVSAISIGPKHSITRWTYGLTGAALLLGVIAITAIDLDRALPKLVSAQRAQSATSQASSTPTTTNSNTSTSSPTTTTPVQTYQPPVTSVS